MFNKTVIFLIGLLSVVLYSNAQKNYANILKLHKWATESITAAKPIDLNKTGKPSTDLLAQSSACIKDDILVFKDKGVLIRDDNKVLCNMGSMANGSWRLNKDILQLSYGGKTKASFFKITSLDDHQLTIVSNMPFVPGGVNVTYVYKAL